MKKNIIKSVLASSILLASFSIKADTVYHEFKTVNTCTVYYKDYFDREKKFRDKQSLLTLLVGIYNPLINIFRIIQPKKQTEFHEQASIVYELIKESKNGAEQEIPLISEYFNEIKVQRPDLTSAQDLKNLIRAADEKYFFCRPVNDYLETITELSADLASGKLSHEVLNQEILNPKQDQSLIIPLSLSSFWNGDLERSVNLLEYNLGKVTEYVEDMTEEEVKQSKEALVGMIKNNLRTNLEKIKIPKRGSKIEKQFWMDFSNISMTVNGEEKNLIEVMDDYNEAIKESLRKSLKQNPSLSSQEQFVINAEIEISKSGPILVAQYNYNYNRWDLKTLKEVKTFEYRSKKITRMIFRKTDHQDIEEKVIWYTVTTNGEKAFFASLNEAAEGLPKKQMPDILFRFIDPATILH